jgi:hypothetical protein
MTTKTRAKIKKSEPDVLETDTTQQPKQQHPTEGKRQQIYRVLYITARTHADRQPDAEGQPGTGKDDAGRYSIGHYVRAQAIWQGLERYVRAQVSTPDNPALDKLARGNNGQIEFSVVSFDQGNFTAGVAPLLTIKKQGGNEGALKVGILRELHKPDTRYFVEQPGRVLHDYFRNLDRAHVAPDLVIVDGVSTMWAMADILQERNGRSKNGEILKPGYAEGSKVLMQVLNGDSRNYSFERHGHIMPQIAKQHLRKISPLRNAKIWLLVRYEHWGLPFGQEWVHAVDRLYFLENWTPGACNPAALGWFLAKEQRSQANLYHQAELTDRKLIGALALQPEPANTRDATEDMRLRPGDLRRKYRRRLLDAVKQSLPDGGTDAGARRPLRLIAGSRIRPGQASGNSGLTEARARLEAATGAVDESGADNTPVEIWATPAELPGGVAGYAEGVDGLATTCGYNSVWELRHARQLLRKNQHLHLGFNLQFAPTAPLDEIPDQHYRARNIEKLWSTRRAVNEPGNGADYLAEQVFRQAQRKFDTTISTTTTTNKTNSNNKL